MLAHRHACGVARVDRGVLSSPLPSSHPAVLLLSLHLRCGFRLLTSVDNMPTPNTQCPVHGCGVWSNRWGNKSYPLPSTHSFTLLLASTVDVSINNRICQPCWKRHHDHNMPLDSRTRVHPIASPSPLDALLSAAISPLPQISVPLSSPAPSTSLPSDTLTQARVITVFPTHSIVSSSASIVQPPSNHSIITVQPQSNHSPALVQH